MNSPGDFITEVLNNLEIIKIKKLSEKAIVPARATEGSAGMDLCACIEEGITLKGGETALIPTGIAAQIPSGFGLFIFPRSGLSIKHGIGLLNSVGVVDSDYRGEIKVGVINQISESYTIEPGERIAQMVLMPVALANTVVVDSLEETDRGDGGFGSTGRK